MSCTDRQYMYKWFRISKGSSFWQNLRNEVFNEGFLTQLPVHSRFSLLYKRMPMWFHNLKAQTKRAIPCLYLVRKICKFVKGFSTSEVVGTEKNTIFHCSVVIVNSQVLIYILEYLSTKQQGCGNSKIFYLSKDK